MADLQRIQVNLVRRTQELFHVRPTEKNLLLFLDYVLDYNSHQLSISRSD